MITISELHGSYACSSLILGNLGTVDVCGDWERTPAWKQFIEGMDYAINGGSVPNDDLYDEDEEPILDAEGIRRYAYVIAHTVDEQETPRQYLSKLGFNHLPPSIQDKNYNTAGEVYISWMDADQFVTNVNQKMVELKGEEKKKEKEFA